MSVQAISCAFALRGISSSEKLVLLALANYADENMRCWPSQETLARETELSERTVWGALKSLEEKRVLSREQRKRADGTRSTDVFTLHFYLTITSEPVAKAAKSTRKSCETNSQNLRDQPAAIATLTTFEPSREPSEAEPLEAADESAPLPSRKSGWSRESLDVLQARLRAAAGASINAASPSLPILAAIVGLLTPGDGPACDLELDVIPAIEAAGRKARPGSVNRWEYFRPMIVEARDRRLSGAPGAKQSPSGVDGWDEDTWDRATFNYYKDGSWGSKMGPKPGEIGCRVPKNILNKYEHLRRAA